MPYVGKAPVGGGFHKLDALTASATATYALTLGGAAYYPETANQLLVSLNGVIQAPQDSFTVSGSNLVFDSALTSSDSIDFVVALGDVLGVGSVTDGAITTAKIGNNAVTDAKIAAMAASKLTGSVPSAAMPTGSVMQVVYADTGTSSNVTFNNSGWTSIALTALITPSSTSSKILVDFTPHFRMSVTSGSDVGLGWRILRNGSSVEDTATTYHSYFYNNGGFIDLRGTDRVSFLDTPSSTSQLTYTFEGRKYNSAGISDGNNTGNKSRVTLMEIAG